MFFFAKQECGKICEIFPEILGAKDGNETNEKKSPDEITTYAEAIALDKSDLSSQFSWQKLARVLAEYSYTDFYSMLMRPAIEVFGLYKMCLNQIEINKLSK